MEMGGTCRREEISPGCIIYHRRLWRFGRHIALSAWWLLVIRREPTLLFPPLLNEEPLYNQDMIWGPGVKLETGILAFLSRKPESVVVVRCVEARVFTQDVEMPGVFTRWNISLRSYNPN